MTHRPAPVATRLCAALSVFALVIAAPTPADALLIDHFDDATNPTFAGTRFLDNSPGFINVFPVDSVLSYDGGESAGVIFEPTTPLNLAGYGAIAIDFGQIADADDNPLDSDIVVILDDGTDFAVLGPSALPFLDGTDFFVNGNVTTLTFNFADFTGIGSIDTTAITAIAIYFDGESPIIIVADAVYLVPAPAALPAGLIGFALLAVRRRRRSA